MDSDSRDQLGKLEHVEVNQYKAVPVSYRGEVVGGYGSYRDNFIAVTQPNARDYITQLHPRPSIESKELRISEHATYIS